MSKKEMLADFIETILPDRIYRYLSLLAGNTNKLKVLAYHRVMDVDENYPFDIELISASCRQFEEQIEYISKYYTAITLEQLVECVENDLSLPDNSILITFDDGFEDNFKNAFPILKRYNVPATIFISTGYISSNNTFWFDELAYFILNVEDEALVKVLKYNFKGDVKGETRREILEEVMEYVKLISNNSRLKLISDLYAENQFTYKKEHKMICNTLTWEQVREMDLSLISFGSHTVNHPILSQLDDKNLGEELSISKQCIEEKLQHSIDCIAYPVGTHFAFDKKVIDCTKNAQYKLGFSYVSGINKWPLDNCYTIKRLHVERYTTRSLFKGMLALPGLLSV